MSTLVDDMRKHLESNGDRILTRAGVRDYLEGGWGERKYRAYGLLTRHDPKNGEIVRLHTTESMDRFSEDDLPLVWLAGATTVPIVRG